MNNLSKLVALVLLLSLAACERPDAQNDGAVAAQTATTEDVRADLEAANDRWIELANAGDVEALANLYNRDAIIVTPHVGTVRGRDQILQFFRDENYGEEPGSLTTERMSVSESQDMAYILGRWSSESGYGGSYLSVLTRDNGTWMWASDAWNVETMPEE